MSSATRVRKFLFAPVPLARIAYLRWLVYGFVLIDVLFLHTSGWYHGFADPQWYQALKIGQLLNLPAASVLLVQSIKWVTVVAALIALSGKGSRWSGWVVALSWSWYQYIAFSYGKVDHDRGDFVIALLLLPTVGFAHFRDLRRSEAAGFAIRMIQLGAIAAYFLSGIAKLRFGGSQWGLSWFNSATLARAVLRRGTPFGQFFLEYPWFLHAAQWFILTAELLSWIIFFLPERWRRLMVLGWFLFHAGVYATITIAFWPHLVMMLGFLPLEKYGQAIANRMRGARAGS